jgi:chloramphenicol-sensitive protein RarD
VTATTTGGKVAPASTDGLGHPSLDPTGLVLGVGAYGIWGVFPLYFRRLAEIGPWEIAAFRIAATTTLCWVLLRIRGELSSMRVLRRPATLLSVAGSGLMITTNWLVYIWAVNAGHVVDAAIGYYVNPLITVALGVVVLRERLRHLQKLAIALGATAVAVLTVAYGRVPWVALVLACSFATYGYLKKTVALGSMQSLAAETLVMAPFALVLLAGIAAGAGLDAAAASGTGLAWLSVIGLVTAVPLLCFGGAARRIPLAQLGLLQYLTPTLQLLCALLVFHERVPVERWVGMAIVWCALAALALDAAHASTTQAR